MAKLLYILFCSFFSAGGASGDSVPHAVNAASTGSDLESLLENERANFRSLSDAVAELGAVPHMLRSADMSATIPDEKVRLIAFH